MRIDRAAHLPWVIFVAVASALAALFYAAEFHPQRLPAGLRFFGEQPPDHATIGGTPVGLVFGTISLGIFIFAALLGARKKLPWLPVGNVQRWLRAHIWLTLLTVPLILLHSGFSLGSPMTTVLMALYAIVMLSGIYGLSLQQRIPTLMKERLPAEIVYEQIPNIRAQLESAAERLHKTFTRERASDTDAPRAVSAAVMPDVSIHAVLKTPSAAEKGTSAATVRGTQMTPAAFVRPDKIEAAQDEPGRDAPSEEALAAFIERRLLPYLRARRGDKLRLGNAREADEAFSHLKSRIAAPYRVRVEEMQGWCDERRLLDEQMRMQHWLHGWLLVHVPVSFLLLLMTAWHAFVTLFRY